MSLPFLTADNADNETFKLAGNDNRNNVDKTGFSIGRNSAEVGNSHLKLANCHNCARYEHILMYLYPSHAHGNGIIC